MPGSLYKTLVFMEHATEVKQADKLSNDDAMKKAIERRQATHMPVAMIIAFESAVLRDNVPRFVKRCADQVRRELDQ